MGRKKPVKSKGDVGEENMVASGSGSEEKITLLPVNTKLIWQLQDKSDWSTYSTEISEALNSAAVLCKLQVDAEAGPRTKLVLNIKDMVQQAKSSSKPIRCLVEGEEGLVSWTIKETEKSLQPGIAARLNQVVDISSEVSLDGFKYDLVNMIREKDGVKESLLREKVVPTKFKKTGITGKISLCPTPAEEEEEEEEEVSPPKKSKKEKSNKSKVKSGEEAKEMKPVMKSFVRKGLAPVDPDCPHKDNYHVYTEGREVWDTMLNQTNIQNNNNKYYLIQLLKADSGNSYAVWMRWGRVGYKGQNSWTTSGSDLDAAKSVFTKKFQDKTKNLWEDRYSFEKYPGKYDMVLMDYSAGGQDSVDSAGSSGVGPVVKSDPESKLGTPVPDSTLEKRVQDLISLICDIKTMEQAVVEMEYDAEKAPLGKITTEQIRAGYQALKKISDCITGGKTSGGEITQACNDFYTRIPHEFGFKVPPIIRTHAEVKRKIELLEALSDIQVALKMLSTEQDTSINPIDRRYNQLKVDIKALDVNENERKAVEKSILNTHAPTHSNYTMEILDVFKINKEEEKSKFIDVGNTKLLYHGSRLSNWAGILGTGLRIAPPEAPVTGYMFGKGVYFADMSSKSANYCFTNRSQNIGLLLICEVALGKQNTLLDADYNADKLPKGYNSVLGAGKMEPGGWEQLGGGLQLPGGIPRKTNVDKKEKLTLQYNEYIVYDTKQIKMKYLAKIKFNHKY